MNTLQKFNSPGQSESGWLLEALKVPGGAWGMRRGLRLHWRWCRCMLGCMHVPSAMFWSWSWRLPVLWLWRLHAQITHSSSPIDLLCRYSSVRKHLFPQAQHLRSQPGMIALPIHPLPFKGSQDQSLLLVRVVMTVSPQNPGNERSDCIAKDGASRVEGSTCAEGICGNRGICGRVMFWRKDGSSCCWNGSTVAAALVIARPPS